MTEAEWLECTDPTPMLEFLWDKVSDRKLRLFGCGCCRRIWHLIVHPVSRKAVEVAEQFADGLASDDERHAIFREADDIRCLLGNVGTGLLEPDAEEKYGGILERAAITPDAAASAADEAWGCAEPEPEGTGIGASAAEAVANFSSPDAEAVERAAQANLLRDMIANPFRPVTFDPSWCKGNVVKFARTIYDKRAFDRLPKLADALEKAGCNNGEVLAHYRQPGEHVRGCWAVDLLLGKE
jgi:hypothetical protein